MVVVVCWLASFTLQNSEFGLLTGRNAVYSELKGQACSTAESGVTVQSADGFIIEQYSRVRAAFVFPFLLFLYLLDVLIVDSYLCMA